MHQFRALARSWCACYCRLRYKHTANKQKADILTEKDLMVEENTGELTRDVSKQYIQAEKESTKSVRKHKIGASYFKNHMLLFNCKMWRGEKR